MKRVLAALWLASLSGMAGATTGYFQHGYGMKSMGMGGVGLALPQDALAAASNPAGMVLLGDRIDFGMTWFDPKRGASITGNGGGANGDLDGNGEGDFLIPEFGYNRMLNASTSLGVSVYGNGGMNTTYDRGVPLFGTSKAGVDLMQLFIAPTVAYKINDDHAIGVSLNLVYQRFKALGLQNFDNAVFSANPGSVTDRGYDSSTGAGLHIGWVGKLSPTVSLGAAWQSKTRMTSFDKYKGLFAEGGDFDIPETYGLGIAVRATDKLTLAADVQEIKYGDVKSIANSGALPTQLGSANGPGFGWRDMTVFKLGVSYEVSPSLTLRGGLVTGRQPIPANETLFNILAPGVIEDHITLGATWTLANKSELTVGYMHAFKKTINGSGSIGAAFGGGEANLHMYQDSLGVAYGWKM